MANASTSRATASRSAIWSRSRRSRGSWRWCSKPPRSASATCRTISTSTIPKCRPRWRAYRRSAMYRTRCRWNRTWWSNITRADRRALASRAYKKAEPLAAEVDAALSLRRFPDRDALVLEQRLQFAGLEHLAHDVAAADELALDVKLRDGRPVRIVLDAAAQVVVFQHVEALIGHAQVIQDLYDLAGEAAHRELRRALHEQHDVVALYFIVDELLD